MIGGSVDYSWRRSFTDSEVSSLHAEAFRAPGTGDAEADHAGAPTTRSYPGNKLGWNDRCDRHSFGWVTARQRGELVGFVNVISDGSVHAWLQDVMVAAAVRHRGVGRQLVGVAREATRTAGHEWLHVDFEAALAPFYFDACGFEPTVAGLQRLRP